MRIVLLCLLLLLSACHAFFCSQWTPIGTLAGSRPAFSAATGLPSEFGLYRLSDASATRHLYIRDDSPEFFSANWPAPAPIPRHWVSSSPNTVQCSVDGRTFVPTSGNHRSEGNPGCDTMAVWLTAQSPPAVIIGDHVCGTSNGWILVLDGSTYDQPGAPHPCPVPGVVFTQIDACRDGVDISTGSALDLTFADLEVLMERAGGSCVCSSTQVAAVAGMAEWCKTRFDFQQCN